VDRIQEKIAAGERFAPRDPAAKDLAAYVMKGAWTSPRMDFELSEPAELVEHVARPAERYRRAVTSGVSR
jgi:hypothetical protein